MDLKTLEQPILVMEAKKYTNDSWWKWYRTITVSIRRAWSDLLYATSAVNFGVLLDMNSICFIHCQETLRNIHICTGSILYCNTAVLVDFSVLAVSVKTPDSLLCSDV